MIVRRKFLFLPPVVGSERFCSLRHASNGFFHDLATVSFGSQLVRAMSAVCICCNTNSRFCTPQPTFVSLGKNSRSIALVVVETVLFSCPLEHHLRLLDHTSEERLRLLLPLLKILLSARKFLRTTKAFHTDETRSDFSELILSRDC